MASSMREMDPLGKSDHDKAANEISSNKSDVNEAKQLPVDTRRLNEEEEGILNLQVNVPDVKIGLATFFRYATRKDLVVFSVSSLCAIAGGAILPLMSVVFGSLAQSFQSFTVLSAVQRNVFNDDLVTKTLYLVYIAIGEYVFISTATFGFIWTGTHVTQRIREEYLSAIMRQNIAFFDTLGTGEVINRITSDLSLVQDGISEKVGFTMTGLATFVAAFVIGFVMYWKLTLILTATLFAVLFSLILTSIVAKKYSVRMILANASAAAVSDEVISSIRNAIAFNTQEKLAKQYDKFLIKSEKAGFGLGIAISGLLATCIAIVELTYALAFWQGSRFLVNSEINLARLLTTVLAIVLGSFALVNIAANFQAFAVALPAAKKIFSTIDRISPMNHEAEDGVTLDHVEGQLKLQNIGHVYPSRPDVCVMEDFSLAFEAGKTTALVGNSGSGKSTIVGLVERFYEPIRGRILLDGYDVSKLNLKWMRQQLALVSQEPVLFGTTIYENIRHGLIGTPYEMSSQDIQEQMIFKAAKTANIHDFILALPDGYQTQVGQRGLLMSGGEKQRIAISRAVVSDPKILLLDEATSALDTKSEEVVQVALNAAAKGRTTIIIAHRLSTIKNADKIVVMSGGRIVEQGTHDDLLEKKAAYYALVQAQEMSGPGSNEDPEEGKSKDEDIAYAKPINRDDDTTEFATATTSSPSGDESRNACSSWTLLATFAAFNTPEWPIMLIGLIFSILAGGTYPTQSLFFAKSVSSLALPPAQFAELRSDINFWSWMYFMLAVVAFINFLIQGVALGYGSSKLTSRVASRAFRDIIKQDVSFFDQDEHTVGSLTSFLATQPASLSGFSGSTLGAILNVLSTIISALALSLAISWKLGLVCGATIPVLLASGFYRFWIAAELAKRSKKAYALSASFAAEATSAIRTIASLTREKDVLKLYHETLVEEQRLALATTLKSANLYALSQAFPYLCMALGFWYGGHLISNGEIGMFEFYLCYNALIFTIQSAGRVLAFAPELGKAKNAAVELKILFDREPRIHFSTQLGAPLGKVVGNLEFRNVHFSYSPRSDVRVLQGLSFKVMRGQYIALVGASGCGKSTILALLERFYDPVEGGIIIDDKDISSLHLTQYRNILALVSQEPTLYQGTVRENILLGTDRDDIDDDSIVQACKDADIYDLIMSLPDGFSTSVGTKGVLLSGGQKQRLAIARALIRDPQILLLDEATSALDTESEKSVQAALDKAMRGRTTIAVAHRLSTIQRADVIIVIDRGRVAEQGTHSELLSKRGLYFDMVRMQSLGKMDS